MKREFINIIRPLYIQSIISVFIAVFSFYTDLFSQAGGQPGAFLSYGVGARALGMGELFLR
ncbi:MAG TPA: hypothetical protein PK103_07865 [Elusimicrobiales bacterium]|nr:hypothetical protein [Elusimicrobiales bacterium]